MDSKHKCSGDDCIIKKYFSLDQCSFEEDQSFSASKACVTYRSHQKIIEEGEQVLGLYIIREGKVKEYKRLGESNQIVRLCTSGDILGFRGVIHLKDSTITAETLVETKICFVEWRFVKRMIQEDIHILQKLMVVYEEQLSSAEEFLINNTLLSVKRRIAEAIHYIQSIYGDDEAGYIDVVLSRREIAEIAGTYSEQVSRSLKVFEDQELIKMSGKRIRLLKSIEVDIE